MTSVVSPDQISSGTILRKVKKYKHPESRRHDDRCLRNYSDVETPAVYPPHEITQKLFVGGLSWNTTADMLKLHFRIFGNVTNAYIIIDPATKQSRGFGFVEFDSPAAVRRVLETPRFIIDGRYVECKPSYNRQKATSYQERRIVVTNLPDSPSHKELIQLFTSFGTIEYLEFDGPKMYITYSDKQSISKLFCASPITYQHHTLHIEPLVIKDLQHDFKLLRKYGSSRSRDTDTSVDLIPAITTIKRY